VAYPTADRISASTGIRTSPTVSTLAIALMVLALIAPALWNGFPLIFPDTGGYLNRPLSGTLELGRSALYGLFLYAGVPFSFWPNVLIQSVIIVWLLLRTARAVRLADRPWLVVGLTIALTVVTSLPWFVAQLMPDIFFSAAVLASYLLAFQHDQLRYWERTALAGLIAFAIACHMAIAGMCVVMVAVLWVLATFKTPALPDLRMSILAGSVAVGVALCPMSNFAITGKFTFTPGGPSFLFGRLVEDGIVARYLDDHCPDPTLQLCEYRLSLPEDADGWLWWGGSPFWKLGGWKVYQDEEQSIIWASLKEYPLTHVFAALSGTIEQLTRFQTEVAGEYNTPTTEMFGEHYPELFNKVMSSRQHSENFDVGFLNWLHVPVAAISVVALLFALISSSRKNLSKQAIALCVIILLALAINAALCAVFAHPVDRYQSRLIWLAPFAMGLLLLSRNSERVALRSI